MGATIKRMLPMLTVLSCVGCEKITVSGKEGGTASIDCPPYDGYANYPKYLCKGIFKDCVDVIRSDGRAVWTHKGRISLHDKKSNKTFTVLIHHLTLEDAGIYGCGVDNWGPDYYFTEVYLKVDPKKPSDPKKATTEATTVIHIQPSEESPTYNRTSTSTLVPDTTRLENSTHVYTGEPSAISSQLMFLSGGLVAALLVFGLLIMTFRLVKNKHKRTAQTPSGNTGEDCHVYSEIRDPTPLDLNMDPDETSSSSAVYSLATPADPIGLQPCNQNQESTPDIYTLATNLTTVSPSETISVVNQDAGSKTDIYSLATNLKPLNTTLVTNQDCDSKPDIYSLATNPTPALNTSCLSLKADQSAEIEGGIYCNLELADERESVAFTDRPNDSSVSVCFTKTPAGPK